MPFEIVRNDITKMYVDAIVNTANPRPVIGLGTDSQIHEAAGLELLMARQKIGSIGVGCAAITPAYNLQAEYVIHTVGPVWNGGSSGEEQLLRNCYDNALQLALEHDCRSVAFPLISTGNYGFPKDKALQVAVAAFSAFLMEHEMQIYLVVFNRQAFQLSEKLFHSVASYIDQNYVDEKEWKLYGREAVELRKAGRRRRCADRERMGACEMKAVCEDSSIPMPMAAKTMTLEDALKAADIGFSEALLQLIDKSGKKDSEIYKKANISKQHFSKIKNNPQYKPSKATALALAIALELDVDQTRELIGRAGFALTNSSKQDLIVKYFIERKQYNIIQINIALYEFDQGLLGSA